MKQIIKLAGLSAVAAAMLHAESATLETIEVEDTGTTTIVKDVAGAEVQSADLADALYSLDPDVQLIRRSGIANDIILRGMRKDNINVLIDGGKIYGACPNRMDPPISHVVTNNVDSIVIKEGPFDVQNFGTLAGVIDVNTLKPTQDPHGSIYLNAGSWNYSKLGAEFSGGSDRVRVMIGGSTESSRQYKDGDGNTLSDQLDNYIKDHPSVAGAAYLPQYKDMKAYTKKSGMAKLFVDVTDNQELQLSYTQNRSNDVLYPNSKMDALKDVSHLFNAKYVVRNLGSYSKELDFEFYNSWVYHPMGTYYRASSVAMGVMENRMWSRIFGGKIKNSMDLMGGVLHLGFDGSHRMWKGEYYKNYVDINKASIDHAITKDAALFADYTRRYGRFGLDTGLRYDMASVQSDRTDTKKNSYDYLSGYLFSNYHLDENYKLFGGFGVSSRVPDGKELYFVSSMGAVVGNPDLKRVTNNEFDLGIEGKVGENATFRLKGFYSLYNDFIFYNMGLKTYENRDATVYGASLDGTYALNDAVYFDGGIAWLKGEKKDPLTGQSGTNMPNITPLKTNVAVNWDYADAGTMRLSMVAADGWSDYDAENGEQKISGYAVFNFKLTQDFLDHYRFTFGVDNILDKTYAVTNTYADMTLVNGGVQMVLNEPGRYIYGNFSYHF